MALGTARVARCSHCDTVWRVVADQLKVSDGWLRCGACGQPLDAAYLCDPQVLPRDATLAPAAGLPLLQQRADMSSQAPAPLPSFMQSADRRSGRPWTGRRLVRALLLLLVFMLCCLALLWQRDRIAVGSPALGAWLEQACAQIACDPHGRQNIDAIVIEQSDLLRLDEQQLELQVTIANTSRLPVLLPALQLALLDALGNVLWQRTLQADELVAAQAVQGSAPTLLAGQALALRKTVTPERTETPVSGYRLLALYP